MVWLVMVLEGLSTESGDITQRSWPHNLINMAEITSPLCPWQKSLALPATLYIGEHPCHHDGFEPYFVICLKTKPNLIIVIYQLSKMILLWFQPLRYNMITLLKPNQK